MRTLGKDLFTAMLLGLIVPGILLNFAVLLLETPNGTSPTETTAIQETLPETVSMPMLLRSGDTLTPMDMDEYLVGVVLAEMPATFEIEALKAQAVAARTYTHKAYTSGGKHADGSVCTSSGCCQAYISPEDYLSQGGTEAGLEKVRAAVADTSGYVLTYGGELIEATYFSCSGGQTESAVAVWGTDYPYLQSVTSPGEEKAIHDRDTVTFPISEFQQALGVELSDTPSTWFQNVTYTTGGGIETMTIGDQVYSGTTLRAKLGLRSTAVSFQVDGSNILVTTRGYGHRVGMSQYGADAMAVTGSTYPQILAHYYQGAELTKLDE